MTIQTIPLSKLSISASNVRKTGGQSIDDLAASIQAHGLLQNLTVIPAAKGRFEVVAGGRRLAALQLLAKEKRLARDFLVPCVVREAAEAVALSLTENIIRQAMHPADQFDAFKALADGGMGEADIAARFGLSEDTVKQRLRLATVSPKLMQVYRDDGMKLEQLMAFTVCDDHAKQETAWFGVQAWDRTPHDIRRKLTESKVRAEDRRVRFVGLDAYVAAGGTVTRDLFAEQGEGYLDDSDLLQRLFAEKLIVAAAEVEAEGWAWVTVAEKPFSPYEHDLRQLPAPQRDLSDEEQARIEKAQTELAGFEGLDELTDEQADRVEQLEAQIDEVEHADRSDWSGFDRSTAGAVVSVDHKGERTVARGLIGKDEKLPAGHGSTSALEPKGKARPEFSAALLADLTAHRTQALQAAMIGNPAVAVKALIHALALSRFYGYGGRSCVHASVSTTPLRQHAGTEIVGTKAGMALQEAEARWRSKLPSPSAHLWDWLDTVSDDEKLTLLAFLVAQGIDAMQTGGGKANPHTHQLQAALGLDMADWWQPTASNFLSRVSKAQVIGALAESSEGLERLAAFHAMKKPQLVTDAEKALDGKRWLPFPLRAVEPQAHEEEADIDDSAADDEDETQQAA